MDHYCKCTHVKGFMFPYQQLVLASPFIFRVNRRYRFIHRVTVLCVRHSYLLSGFQDYVDIRVTITSMNNCLVKLLNVDDRV